ncbi:MAG: hypothetical protein LUD22_01730 [Coprobacillus sp.]|nr:hypothetical protein [Coprobacillus sp.]
MNIKLYLNRHQPVIYRTFYNALENNNLSHAYLLVGDKGSPLVQIATFLGKSLLCENPDPYACDQCITCIRVDDGNYPDFIVYDGEKETIKLQNVSSIAEQFEMKPFEKKGIMIYVLNLVENMTLEAINSILKFLEEPQDNVYAFLTTNNEEAVLPTIRSRCQIMHLLPVNKKEIVEEAVDLGVTQKDAEILSFLYNDSSLISELVNNNEEYLSYTNTLDLVTSFIEKIPNKSDALYIMDKNIIPFLKGKESVRDFLDILSIFFEEALNIKNGLSPFLESYDTIVKTLVDSVSRLEDSLIEIQKARSEINLNVNTGLLLDHLTNIFTGK